MIQKMKVCTACDLSKNRTQVVVGDYGPKNSICFVGEAPGYNEDKEGRPFVGRSGSLLNEMLDEIGLGRKNVSVLNIAKCRPPNNRNPTISEQKICGNMWLVKQLQHLSPVFIVTLGSVPLNYFSPGKKITKIKGKLFEEGDYLFYPMLHPAYVLRGGSTRDQYLADFELMYQKFNEIQQNGFSSNLEKNDDLKSDNSQSSLEDFL